MRTESGLPLVADARSARAATTVDTLVVPGGNGVHAATADACRSSATVARAGARGRAASSTVCSGAFLLAAAGLLDGRRARPTGPGRTAWPAEHPDVDVDADPIWVRDGNVWTSAGVTAGIDVALALVEDDHGVDVAETVARWLVMFLRRPGGQSQFAGPVWRPRARGSSRCAGPRT